MINKTEIKNELKELGLENIRYQTYGSSIQGKCVRINGKLVQGIKGSTHSPMDVTSLAFNRTNDVREEIKNKLQDIMILENDSKVHMNFIANKGKGKKQEFKVIINRAFFQTYERSINLDSGYKTSWWILRFE